MKSPGGVEIGKFSRVSIGCIERDSSLRRNTAFTGCRNGEQILFDAIGIDKFFHRTQPDITALGIVKVDSDGIVEGWRGEVVHFAITGAEGNLLRYKIKDPSFNNWYMLAMAVRNNGISDFPLCNKSFNLSYCGNDL